MTKLAIGAAVTCILALACGKGTAERGSHAQTSSAVPPPEVRMEPPAVDEVDVFEQARRLGRGINIGNALDAPSEGAWGVTIQESQFETIAAAGFDSIRLPVRWSAHADASEPFTIEQSFFDRVDWAIAHALGRGLAVVLDVHHFEEIYVDPAANQDRLFALWEQLSEHYQDYPKELFFELLNEPNAALDASIWNDFAADLVPLIRNKNPGRTLLIGGENWNSIHSLETLELPENDRNIIATFHYYEPFDFTHQGASWVESPPPLGRAWPQAEDEADVEQAFSAAVQWSVEQGRPIHLGEFGAIDLAEMDSRARWTSFVVERAIESGIPFHYWEYESGFGAYDPAARTWRPQLIEALQSGPNAQLPLQQAASGAALAPRADSGDSGAAGVRDAGARDAGERDVGARDAG
jgi:endoglucanase